MTSSSPQWVGIAEEFTKVIQLFESYRAKFKSQFVGSERDRSTEAIARLCELQTLAERVTRSFTEAATLMESDAARAVDVLRENASNDPKLAEYLVKNPNPRLVNFLKAWAAEGPRLHLGSEADNQRVTERERDMEADTRAFYYVAHRLVKVVNDLPRLQAFSARGITVVRNQLMEHPEGKGSGVALESFGYGGKTGPVVKALRYSPQLQHQDSGFVPNCEQLLRNLRKSLERALTEW